MNISLSFAGNQMRGISIEDQSAVDSRGLAAALLNGDVSDATLATIAKATTTPQMVALTLGAPEFQRR
jgi:hypothetical protein